MQVAARANVEHALRSAMRKAPGFESGEAAAVNSSKRFSEDQLIPLTVPLGC